MEKMDPNLFHCCLFCRDPDKATVNREGRAYQPFRVSAQQLEWCRPGRVSYISVYTLTVFLAHPAASCELLRVADAVSATINRRLWST